MELIDAVAEEPIDDLVAYIREELRRQYYASLLCPKCEGHLVGDHEYFDAWCYLCGYGRTSLLITTPHVAYYLQDKPVRLGINDIAVTPDQKAFSRTLEIMRDYYDGRE